VKVYEAEVRLGWATDTYDAEGTPIPITGVTAERSQPTPGATREELDPVLERFRGTYEQTPPAFSAKKIDGVRAYALARRGLPTRAKPVQVTVHHLSIIGRTADAIRVRLECSAGFYVRTFAHDLGLALGVGGHLAALRRCRSGEFDVADAVPLDVAEQEGQAVTGRMVPLDGLLPAIPAAVVTQAGAARTRHGNLLRPVDFLSFPDGFPRRVRVLDEHGALLAVADRSEDGTVLHPGVVVR
jgi:tRNA pseudouridine55 synthase